MVYILLPPFNDVSKPMIANYRLIMKLSELGQNRVSFLFHSFLFTHQRVQWGSLLPALLVAKVTDPHLEQCGSVCCRGQICTRGQQA